MSEFFSLLKVVFFCGTAVFITTTILLALPQCRLRSVGLEMTKWFIAGGLVLLTISPIDLIPLLPIDDVGYIIGAICAAKSAINERKQRAFLDA